MVQNEETEQIKNNDKDSSETQNETKQEGIEDTKEEENISDNIDNKEHQLMEEIESLKEEKIRLLAEMENLRKRFEREKVDTIKFGSINLARDILSPADNLERALGALPEKEEYSKNIKNLVEGLKMVLKEFKNILERHGVKKIEAMDKKFDHNFHQAMMEVEKDDVDEGTVVQ